MCVEWNCHYFFFFIRRILACSCFVCLCYRIMWWKKINKYINEKVCIVSQCTVHNQYQPSSGYYTDNNLVVGVLSLVTVV